MFSSLTRIVVLSVCVHACVSVCVSPCVVSTEGPLCLFFFSPFEEVEHFCVCTTRKYVPSPRTVHKDVVNGDESQCAKPKYTSCSFPFFPLSFSSSFFLISLHPSPFFQDWYIFFPSVPFLPDRLNACLQLHLGCMRGNWVWDLVGFVSLEITDVWEVTKVA